MPLKGHPLYPHICFTKITIATASLMLSAPSVKKKVWMLRLKSRLCQSVSGVDIVSKCEWNWHYIEVLVESTLCQSVGGVDIVSKCGWNWPCVKVWMELTLCQRVGRIDIASKCGWNWHCVKVWAEMTLCQSVGGIDIASKHACKSWAHFYPGKKKPTYSPSMLHHLFWEPVKQNNSQYIWPTADFCSSIC